MSKNKIKLLHVGILLTLIVFIFVALILGTVGYSRSNEYFLKSNGEIVYCGSNIWKQILKGQGQGPGEDKDRIIMNLICSNEDEKKKHDKILRGPLWKDVVIWDGNYEKGYFNNQKRD
ncbi:hypothetical protein [Spiroplasma endosymbiont of 'Nebria riversi']|uniref:hypothetical protein n=1 Tax=Spiroplasma endosymbiont of 'Nebria riversi' TaxID=2792084 RepID=UPI001C052DAE|nr:hypothetical protein [Spiroplasma endosymbiont of 'Nebria riversi']